MCLKLDTQGQAWRVVKWCVWSTCFCTKLSRVWGGGGREEGGAGSRGKVGREKREEEEESVEEGLKLGMPCHCCAGVPGVPPGAPGMRLNFERGTIKFC